MATSSLKAFDLFCLNRKYLIYNLILRNLKLRYRKSYFGIFWTVLIPALNAVVYYFIFQFVMKVQIPNYLTFLLSGLLPWTFFSASVLMGMESLVNNHNILNKVPIPAYSFPLAELLTALINFVASLPVFLMIAVFTGVEWNLSQLGIFILLALLALIAHGITLILAYLFVYLRDLKHLMSIIFQIWFYLTPIVYNPAMIPEQYRPLLYLNPIGAIFEGIHQLLLFNSSIEWKWFGISFAWAFVIFGLAYMTARRLNDVVVENV